MDNKMRKVKIKTHS